MPVNYEVKSQLAKLLATEDLVVETQEVATAQFNVETRVLTLPMWKRASNQVYDMLVGHEVGHALFTPNDWSWEGIVPQQFVNVTEDARIEKLMKRKYPGLHKSFNAGYEELSDQDFFCIDGEDVSKMNLADRANLYFKIGKFIDVVFDNIEESRIIKQIGDAETFEDALEAAKELYAYCKKPQEKQAFNQAPIPNGQSGKVENIDDPNPDESDVIEEEKQKQLESRPDLGSDETNYEEKIEEEIAENAEPEVQTDQTFEERVEEFNGHLSGTETGYYETPDMNIDDYVIPFETITERLHFLEDEVYKDTPKVFEWVDDDYNKYKKSAQKEVNYLVKEFECRKSADQYARSSTARTGVLDCSKLHTYKYNEDLFKKVTTIPDGKNHGLIFILDWSGSMGNCMLDTIKQLYNLMWFCNKCNIPFDVYAFTNSWLGVDVEHKEHIWEDNKFIISGDFRMMNLFTSRCKKKQLEKTMKSIFRMVYSFRRYTEYTYPREFSLSGTPLNEAIIALNKIIPAFKKMHGVQKTHCFILTDGEANALMVGTSNEKYAHKGCKHVIAGSSYLRNRKTGYVYKFDYDYYKFTQVLLEDLKQENKDVNFIGIRICGPREMNEFIRRYMFLTDKQEKQVRKDKYCDIQNTGYTSYFAIQSAALNNDADFDVEEGASKAKIKSAFVKNLKTKSLNKKVLGKFMELVS